MSEEFRLAVIQLNSTDDVDSNLATTRQLLRRAAREGVKLALLPENFGFMGPEREKAELAERVKQRILDEVREAAAAGGINVIAGGYPESSADKSRVYNTAALINADGTVAARYRKLHLFDVSLADGTESLESEWVVPGDSVLVWDAGFVRVGFTICYDLRFPELFRSLAGKGAELIIVPAAFTLHTGKDHWEVLLRARAVENQVYVAAAGQGGNNFPGRTTYGHSMIVHPWGTVLARCADGEGLVVADFDPRQIQEVRTQIPCADHIRRDLFDV